MATVPMELTSADALRKSRAAQPKRRVESPWYYAKKAVAIFPGVDRAIAPDFLTPYYRHWESELTAARKLLNRAMLAGYRGWLPGRAKQIAERYRLDDEWRRVAERRSHASLIDPHELAIFRIERDEQLDGVLRRFEWARIHRRLVPQYWTPDCRVAHKIDFYLAAMRLGLPIPTLRAVVRGGVVDVLQPAQSTRLVCKPENGQGGRAVFILNLPEKAVGKGTALAEMLANEPRVQQGEWVVQDHITVHRDLAPLAMNALPTVRLITMPNEQGEPEILVTYLRFPSDPDSAVDNFAVGGLMGLIDTDSGIMQHAVIMRDLIDHAVHPVSGEAITGRQIPFWRETCDLVRRAHAEGFADYRIIGWDIGITQSGPVIIEANAKPCPQGAQQVQRRGLGETRMGELILWHLADAGAA